MAEENQRGIVGIGYGRDIPGGFLAWGFLFCARSLIWTELDGISVPRDVHAASGVSVDMDIFPAFVVGHGAGFLGSSEKIDAANWLEKRGWYSEIG
jgi:hypothetical protein